MIQAAQILERRKEGLGSNDGSKSSYDISIVSQREKIPATCSVQYHSDCTKNLISSIDFITKVNSIIDIFWRQDMKWFRGKITHLKDDGVFKIYYEDETTEEHKLIEEKIRLVNPSKESPELTFKVPKQMKKLHMQFCRKAQNLSTDSSTIHNRKVAISSVGMLTTKPHSWMPDQIIFSFLLPLNEQSSHKMDYRFYSIDPIQSDFLFGSEGLSNGSRNDFKNYRRNRIEEIPLRYETFSFYEFDYLIWPVHEGSHWRLIISDVSELEIYLPDPYHPKRYEDVNENVRDSVLFFITKLQETIEKYIHSKIVVSLFKQVTLLKI